MPSTSDQSTARARVLAYFARTPVDPGKPLKRVRLRGSRPIGTSTVKSRAAYPKVIAQYSRFTVRSWS